MRGEDSRNADGWIDIDLAPLGRHFDLGGALVTADELEFGSGVSIEGERVDDGCGTTAADADNDLAVARISEGFDAGRGHRHANVDVARDAADIGQPRDVDRILLIDDRIHRQRLSNGAKISPVVRRRISEIVDGFETPRSRKIL